MAVKGVIAEHPKRADIEGAIRRGVSVRSVAKQFGIKHFSAVARYRRKLLASDEKRRQDVEGLSEVDRLARRLDGLWALLSDHLISLDTTGSAKLDKVTLEVIREGRAMVREIANLKGLLKSGVQIGIGVNINNANGSGAAAGEEGMVPSDEVKAALFRVMRRHPEARDELVGEFEALQARFDAPVIDGEAVGHDAAE